jgi:hypothetical protein
VRRGTRAKVLMQLSSKAASEVETRLIWRSAASHSRSERPAPGLVTPTGSYEIKTVEVTFAADQSW